MGRSRIGILLLVGGTLLGARSSAAQPQVLDDFESTQGWSALPADGVDLSLRSDAGSRGRSMRLDFRFQGGGYAVARKSFDFELPENYAFAFRIRGAARPNTLEFKLVDSTGTNVWWSVRRDVHFPKSWETFTIKKRQIQFAWGPAGGGEIRHVAAIEFAVTAGSGGTGSVWIDELEIRPLPPPGAVAPEPAVTASSARPGHAPRAVLDTDSTTAWWSAPGDVRPWIQLDLGGAREYGGVLLAWLRRSHASDYDIEISDDESVWRVVRTVRNGNGGSDHLFLPESESRFLRVVVRDRPRPQGVALTALQLLPLEWSATRETFFQAIAGASVPGLYPRGISGEQPYWTVVGADFDTREVLFDEDGRLETGKRSFCIEPFLYTSDKLFGWKDGSSDLSLVDGDLPIPTVHRQLGDLSLVVTAIPTGASGASSVIGRYRVTNGGTVPVKGTLYLALRPFQVDPPAQFLNGPGGTARIENLVLDGRVVRSDGGREVIALTRPAAFGASTFDGGDVVADWLVAGRLPPSRRVHDDFGAASAALAYPFELAPLATREVDVLVPLHARSVRPRPANAAAARAWVEAEIQRSRKAWRAKLDRVTIELPASASEVTQSLRAQLAYILVNRAGPAIQPGTRAYARSWIRDGALTSSALLRLGHPEAVRAFLDWFAPHQYDNGKIPCVVDWRGADPVPEHDSSGEFIFLVAEYQRYAPDRAYLQALYPRITSAVQYLDALRQERRTAEYRAPEKQEFFGILPPSISHEGYSAKPMHSYWDDFWALRGFADAAWIAGELGHETDRQRFAAMRGEFEHDLVASIEAAMRRHQIDYIPGCADLGDFDATSTTIAVSPVGAQHLLPQAALRRTFEKYGEFFRARRDGAPWEAFTPYEIRNIGAFVHLGWRDEAHALLEWFLAMQRWPAWRAWPEVVYHEPRVPRFLGDLPHGWVGSDYVRSVLDMLAYERPSDDALVVGAGVPVEWLQPAPGVVVRNLPTRYGPLGFEMRADGDGVEVRIEPGLRVPSGGIVIAAPLGGALRAATLDGTPIAPNASGEIVVHTLPAVVRMR